MALGPAGHNHQPQQAAALRQAGICAMLHPSAAIELQAGHVGVGWLTSTFGLQTQRQPVLQALQMPPPPLPLLPWP
jgi:hypothetical protein